MIEGLKPFYNNTLRPVARLFSSIGLHPNYITLFGLLLFIGAAWFCAVSRWYYALTAVIIGSCMDGLDGILARENDMKSRFGAILDSTCDRISEIALLGGIAFFYMNSSSYRFWGPVLCFIALNCSLLISYIKARCEGVGISCNRGILQRPERLILLSTGLLTGPSIMIWILVGFSVLGFATVIQRIFQAAAGDMTR